MSKTSKYTDASDATAIHFGKVTKKTVELESKVQDLTQRLDSMTRAYRLQLDAYNILAEQRDEYDSSCDRLVKCWTAAESEAQAHQKVIRDLRQKLGEIEDLASSALGSFSQYSNTLGRIYNKATSR